MDFIIVDDDPMAGSLLHRYCQKSGNLDCKGIFENGQAALKFLETNSIDLLFLDIEMPVCNGIELLEQLPMFPLIIFTTSKTEYAYNAFEFEAVDYLKKPFSYPRFRKAIEKAHEQFATQTIESPNQSQSNYIYIKDDGRLIKVNLDDILYFENEGDYIKVITQNKRYIINGALRNLVNKLPQHKFSKVHRSYIVNLEYIVDIQDNTLVIGRKVIPISRRNKASLLQQLTII